jgi:hypothetical protein
LNRKGYFQDRHEYVPVGFGRDVLSLTILKIPLPIQAPPLRRAVSFAEGMTPC